MDGKLQLSQTTEELKCKYCNKEFRKLSTLSVHQCETKRRWQQEKETGVQLGFRAFLRFFEYTQGSAKSKTYADFVESQYYSAFVKFGQYLVQIRAVNAAKFIDWVITNNKRLDQWTKDAFYEEFLQEFIRKEHPSDALERSLLTMQEWADEKESNFVDFFKSAAPNKVCQLIASRRISPWVVFNCDSGVNFLSNLNEDQVKVIIKTIEPEYWQKKFKDYLVDAEFIKSVLVEAGL